MLTLPKTAASAKGPLLVLLCLWTLLCFGRVQADDVIHKVVGSDVTLVPKFTGSPSEINWKVDGNKLVEMELSPPRRKFYRVQDRATIDEKYGGLTITKLVIGDTGQYKAEVLVNNNIYYTTINLIVLVQADDVIHKAVGSDVTLVPKYIGSPSEINWKVDGNKLVEMELSPPRRKFYRLQDRATIDEKDGRLTITKLITGDTGQYKAEVLVNNNIYNTTINLIVLAQADDVIHKVVGSDVTLVPKYTGSPSKINWKVDGNNLVEMELSPRKSKFNRLGERVTIDEKDGRLTITKLVIGDTGQYKAEVLVNNNIYNTTINLIVLAQADDVIHKAVGSDVTLVPKYTGSPSEINWKVDVQADVVIHKAVGSDVTLVPKFTGSPSEINWKVDSNKLVKMELSPQKKCPAPPTITL